MKFPICDKLANLKNEGRIPFHMPGHKRKTMEFFGDVTSMDITEITGYDNLHHPEGMIKESMDLLKEIYHSKKSWYLINGSTSGLLSAISAVCQPGDSILIARNCHKAVYNAIRLLHLNPVYFYPFYSKDYDMIQGIMGEKIHEIDEILKAYPQIKAVLITSPTYEGVVSDIAALKEVTSKYQIPLIVDEAHGAHFVFHDFFPKSAVECGADLVIQSAHKTLPSFTQTALLHLCSDLVSEEAVEEMLAIYQTSSPSYLLMASAEYGVVHTQNNRDKVAEYVDKLKNFRKKCGQLRNIKLLEADDVKGFDYDRGKLVFIVKNTKIQGGDFFNQILERFHIEFEMTTAFYGIAMTSVNDDQEDYDRLWEALVTIDGEITLETEEENEKEPLSFFAGQPKTCKPVWEALKTPKQEVALEESIGQVAADYIYLYPPGIPILVPGEKIEKEMVENIRYYLYNGYNVPALANNRIQVLKEK